MDIGHCTVESFNGQDGYNLTIGRINVRDICGCNIWVLLDQLFTLYCLFILSMERQINCHRLMIFMQDILSY